MEMTDDPALDALRLLLLPYRDAYIAAGIAEITGQPLSARAINHWKAGRHFPRPELLAALAVVIERPAADVRDIFARAQLSYRNRKRRVRAAQIVAQAKPKRARRS